MRLTLYPTCSMGRLGVVLAMTLLQMVLLDPREAGARVNLWGNTITFGMTPLIGDQVEAVQSICSDAQAISTNPISCHINLMPSKADPRVDQVQMVSNDIIVYQGDDDSIETGYFVATVAYKQAYLLVPQNSAIKSVKDLKGKKIIALRTLSDASLNNILAAEGVRGTDVTVEAVGPTSVSACKTYDDTIVFYLGMPDDLLTYDLLNSCHLRPIPIDMKDNNVLKRRLAAAYPHYRPSTLNGDDYGQDWGEVPTLSVPFVMVAVPTVYDYKVGLVLQAFLQKSVPRSKFFLTVGSHPLDYLRNITHLPDHQATKKVRSLLKEAA